MNFTYYFGDDDYGYDYEVESHEIQSYLEDNLSDEEIAEYVKEWFESLPKDDQHDILQSFEEKNFACPNFLNWVKEDKDWCITEVLMDDSILEHFEDELKEFFEDDAYYLWKDGEAYRKDPYGYNGVSPSDFF